MGFLPIHVLPQEAIEVVGKAAGGFKRPKDKKWSRKKHGTHFSNSYVSNCLPVVVPTKYETKRLDQLTS